jgi:RNA polymerase sigma factor (sigma-70 family)
MNSQLPTTLLQYLHGAVGVPPSAVSDRDLIQHFLSHHDEESFRALVRRHGTMVRCTCLRVLGNPHDAEDAFQATFLILARRGGSIRENSAGPWLHQVAQRAARRLRADIAQRRAQERQATPQPARPADEVTLRELQAALDEEVAALPEQYRAVLVLCCLEGKTRDEAAQELGWSPGSLKGRLERARALLQERLSWRGLSLSLAFLALALSPAAASAIPPNLAALTVKGCLTGLVSARVAELAAAVLAEPGMGWLQKAALAVVLALALGTAGWIAMPSGAETTSAAPPPPAAVRHEQPPPAPPNEEQPEEEPPIQEEPEEKVPEQPLSPGQRLKEAEARYLAVREAMRKELFELEEKAQAAVDRALAEMNRPGQDTAALKKAQDELNAIRWMRFEVERPKIIGTPERKLPRKAPAPD